MYSCQKHQGTLYALVSALSEAFEYICARFSLQFLHFAEIAFARYIIAIVLSLIGSIYIGASLRFSSTKESCILVFRAIMGISCNLFQYVALTHLPASDVSAICISVIAFAAVLAWIFFKERLKLIDYMCVIGTIGGVGLIVQPAFLFGNTDDSNSSRKLFGAIMAICAMLCDGTVITLVRFLGLQKVSHFKSIFYYSITGAFVCSGITIVFGRWDIPRCGINRLALVTFGVMSFSRLSSFTYACISDSAVYVTIITTIKVVIICILELVILGVVPKLLTIVGIVIIVVSTTTISINKAIRTKIDNNPEVESMLDEEVENSIF